MITRQDYLANGLPTVEFDADRAFNVSQGEATTNLPEGIAARHGMKQAPLPEATQHMEFTKNEAYDHKGEIASTARAIHDVVAPTVTIDDMPSNMDAKIRKKIYSRLSDSDMDLRKVSRKAIEHEITGDLHYWDAAFSECFDPLQKAAKRMVAAGQSEKNSKGIRDINNVYGYLKKRLEDPINPMGDRNFGEQLLLAMFAPGANYPKADKEILASHLVANSRVGNRYARQFANAAQALPQEADPIVDHIQAASGETRVMWEANRLASMETKDFLKGSVSNQDAAAKQILKDLDGSGATSLEERVAAKALR